MGAYTVRQGDTLSGIASSHGVSLKSLEAANPQLRNPNLIFPGQQLHLPDSYAQPGKPPVDLANSHPATKPTPIAPAGPTGTTYRVRSGDTLSAIGARFGVSYQSIAQANGLANPNLIFPGQVLRIPGKGGANPNPTGNGGTGGTWVSGTPGTLGGADTSMWQSDAEFQKSIQGAQWTAIKATEGTNWTDPKFQSRWNELGQRIQSGQMKLRVAYQFMHAGDGTGQAQHFLDALNIHGPLQPGTRLALDWEGSALSDPKALSDAANRIHQVTGTWPLIYTSESDVPSAKSAVPNAPIWEALWGAPSPKNVPFVQYNDGPGFDHDVFNGNLAALDKFAGWA
ncbi:MAG TPA: LysM peptidoglycan-binding domain-containing protein [Myxococcaceae bacterium]|nr:LysM peptidoglycan-binding domain-containing protein [Myxococcaceae bacterium]